MNFETLKPLAFFDGFVKNGLLHIFAHKTLTFLKFSCLLRNLLHVYLHFYKLFVSTVNNRSKLLG